MGFNSRVVLIDYLKCWVSTKNFIYLFIVVCREPLDPYLPLQELRCFQS